MEDMDNPLSKTPATDKKILLTILKKLKGNQILVFLFYLFAIFLLSFLFFKDIEWKETLVLIILTLCLTIIIAISFLAHKSGIHE